MSSILERLNSEGRKTLYPEMPAIAVGMGTCGVGSGADVYMKHLLLSKRNRKRLSCFAQSVVLAVVVKNR